MPESFSLSFTLQKESAPDVFTKKWQGMVNEEQNEYQVTTIAVPAGIVVFSDIPLWPCFFW